MWRMIHLGGGILVQLGIGRSDAIIGRIFIGAFFQSNRVGLSVCSHR